MPDPPDAKSRPHPWQLAKKHLQTPPLDASATAQVHLSRPTAYAELAVTSNFTFLRGGSHPDEFVRQAAELDYRAIGIADTNTLAGVVRAHVAAKEVGIPLTVGCRLEFNAASASSDSPAAPPSLLVYPTDRAAYGRLCRLLTVGKRRADKGECRLSVDDLIEHQEGLLAIAWPPPVLDEHYVDTLHYLKRTFTDDRLSLAALRLYAGNDHRYLRTLADLSAQVNVPLVAVNDVHYHALQRRALQDVLTCIREGCTLDEAGMRLFAHAERYLKPPEEMDRLFLDYPQALRRSVEIAERAAAFNLDELRYQYPDEICPAGMSPIEHLRQLTRQGASERYPAGVPAKVRDQIEHEMMLIEELEYAPYFLTVHDLVVYARSRDILCQGRGAAANSAVCYCLGVTAVDPARVDVLFERFVSRERNEPPDIDIDFEHERREEVLQYIYRKYGRDRAAMTAEVITYRGRSAVREVGKALGLSLDCVDRLAKHVDWWRSDGMETDGLTELNLSRDDATIQHLIAITRQIIGFPRHLSQHVGGFVITRGPLCELVPIENAAMPDRTMIEWDKDDIDAMGMLKVDCLGLGMLTCIRKAIDLINNVRQTEPLHHQPSDLPDEPLALHNIPPEDPVVYDMIGEADTIGVFQIESRAQMSMLPRLKPRCYYDLVIEVAIVRPGPIQGDMVHPYLRRRNGEEPVTYPSDKVQQILGKTLGVPLFQEQAMQLAIVAAGFTPDEADQLRRAIAAWKSKQHIVFALGKRLVDGMIANGYPREFAERCFKQIQGFSEYGFPESHAASFALLVYVSAWLKCHYPAMFAAALTNSQPMGFYAPAQIVRDARQHDVEVRSIDVNHSRWDCTLEEPSSNRVQTRGRAEKFAVRLGMRLVKGLRQQEADAIADTVRRHGPFDQIEPLWRASGVRVLAMRRLASADAFNSMGLDRQAALWHVRALRDDDAPLFEDLRTRSSTPSEDEYASLPLPSIPEPHKVIHDYATTGLSLKNHPLAFVRDELERLDTTPCAQLQDESRWPHGRRIAVAGIVLIRQRPGSANGVVFVTIEDETGQANLIVRPQTFDRLRKAARHATVLLARGQVERDGSVVHVMVHDLRDMGHLMLDIAARSRDFH